MEAVGELYREYSQTVYRLAYRITSSLHDAEDVLQDVFLGLPRALRKYDERNRFEPWLKRVTVRTALMRIRSRERRREDALDDVPPAGATKTEPELVVDRLAMQRALRDLPETLRVVFMLKEVEGYSHAEIAEMLDISSGASAVRLSRAWALLRKGVER